MPLRVVAVDLQQSCFARDFRWDVSGVATDAVNAMLVAELTVAPPGKHPLDLCAALETEWRRHFPIVLGALAGQSRTCIVWAHGPIEPDGLPRVLPYLVSATRERYHISAVTQARRGGYQHGWASFEFSPAECATMIQDADLDLEMTRLYAMAADDDLVERIIARPFWEIGPQWTLANNAIAIAPLGHFEGCHVLGRKSTLDPALNDVPDLLDGRHRGAGEAGA